MIRNRENVAETAKRIIQNRPVLEPIITAFESILEARATLPATLLPLVQESKIILPDFTEEYATNGRSLMSGMSLEGFDKVLATSAKTMLPLLEKQDYMKPFIPALEKYFLGSLESEKGKKKAKKTTSKKKSTDDAEIKFPYQSYQLAEAYLIQSLKEFEAIAEILEMPIQALLFAFYFILAPTLRALVLHSVPAVAAEANANTESEETPKNHIPPWDVNFIWKEGYCPVCSSFPSISYLDRALLDENNQFLASGGGKKYLHCSLCSTNWYFKRGVCPACKEEGPDVTEIIKEVKGGFGERIDWCTKCKSYSPNIDLRVSGIRPEFDMMVLGMIYLDIIAAEKELTPLAPSFWNTF